MKKLLIILVLLAAAPVFSGAIATIKSDGAKDDMTPIEVSAIITRHIDGASAWMILPSADGDVVEIGVDGTTNAVGQATNVDSKVKDRLKLSAHGGAYLIERTKKK